jgi:hypothetical protein
VRPLRSLEITRDGGFSRSWFDNVTKPFQEFRLADDGAFLLDKGQKQLEGAAAEAHRFAVFFEQASPGI